MSNKILIVILTALVSVGGLGGYKIVKDKKADLFENSLHPVVRVIDGDTIEIENKIKIRLLGIDAPEKDECYFDESKSFLKELLAGEDINLEKDLTGKDRYDRLLRYVILPAEDIEEDDILVNRLLLEKGLAVTLAIAPDNRYRDLFSSAQEKAKKDKIGLWGECDYETKDEDLREKDFLIKNPECTIKGNISEKGYGRNYFLEGCPNYSRIKIDERKGESYFCTEKEAEKAGFTKSESCNNTF
jgi:micrococcal nuclease